MTGGDTWGWALDEDLEYTRRGLDGLVELVDLQSAEVVHSVHWETPLYFPQEQLAGKRVVFHFTDEPYYAMSFPRCRRVMELAGLLVARSTQARLQLSKIGLRSAFVPYIIDCSEFRPLPEDNPELGEFRTRWAIPKDGYLIGSFQRDSLGSNLGAPKLKKGPDILAEIVCALRRKGYPVHVVLGGPRRHWLRERLSQVGAPYTFIGEVHEGDDLDVNTFPRSTLNLRYNVIDLCVVSSRSEGGPYAIMEAAAAKCKIISTPVGMAQDVLDPGSIYTSAPEAVRIIERDIREGYLNDMREGNFERILRSHTVSAVKPLLRELYANLENVPVCRPMRFAGKPKLSLALSESLPFRAARRVLKLPRKRRLKVAVWHEFHKPPWGGGNQFLLALCGEMERRGVRLVFNTFRKRPDAFLVNSVTFDVDAFRRRSTRRPLPLVHRIDGPFCLGRGKDRELDELCFRLNAEYASSTVIQSAWTYQRIVEMGYQPVRPVIIHNATDPRIFHKAGRCPFDPDRKVRLISTAWSSNVRKGAALYQCLDADLDWDRYEYTFAGNCPVNFTHIKRLAPMPSEELAEILRQHDVYIAAGQNDSCSNSVLEALACGLPVLYLNSGGHSELVGHGGLPFNGEHEVIEALEELLKNYSTFSSLIVPPSLEEVADKYLELLEDAAAGR